MKNSKIIITCACMCIASSITVYMMVNRHSQNIAVIDAVRLFDSYTMKNELEGIAKVELTAKSRVLDSLGRALQMAKASKRSTEELQSIVYAYDYAKKELDEHYVQSDREINAQVWKRLNPLLNEFGKSKGMHVIIGANGMGTVLFTDEQHDVTDMAIKFINKKYVEGN